MQKYNACKSCAVTFVTQAKNNFFYHDSVSVFLKFKIPAKKPKQQVQ